MHVRRRRLLAGIALAVPAAVAGLAARTSAPAVADARGPESARHTERAARTATPSVWFEANCGQSDPRARLIARAAGFVAFLTDDGAVVRGEGGAFALRFVGASGHVDALAATGGRSHYLVGDDPAAWVRNVPHHAGAVLRDALPGVDVRWRGDGRDLRFDVEVAAGTDASTLRVALDGAERSEIDDAGRLVVVVRGARSEISAPLAWQTRAGRREALAARWDRHADGTFGFAVEGRDAAAPLVIDPTLHAATYLGAARTDAGLAIDTDTTGAIYLAGSTLSSTFPTTPTSGTGAVTQAAYSEPSGSPNFETKTDGFVAKLTPDTQTVTWCTYLGGNDNDVVADVALDGSGNLLLCGSTSALNFPTTAGAMATTGAGFLSRLKSDGTALSVSTYLTRAARRVGADGSGNVIVLSEGSPGQVVKYDSDVTAVTWTNTFTPPAGTLSGRGLFIDTSGNAWVAGATSNNSATLATTGAYDTSYNNGVNDALVWKCDSATGTRSFSTFFGGNLDDQGEDVVLDAAGAIYLCGTTTSTSGFPTTGAFQAVKGTGTDGFVAKLASGGGSLVWSSFYGGNGADTPRGLANNANSDLYLVGETASTNLTVTNGIQTTNAGSTDGFLAKVSSGGALRWSTYFGGASADTVGDVVIGPTGRPAVTGQTASTAFPVKTAAQSTSGGVADAFAWIVEESTAPFGDVSLYDLETAFGYGSATEGVYFNYNAAALPLSGGRSPLTWSLAKGTIPAGLTLTASTGIVNGAPAAGSAGTYRFGCSVVDADGASVVREYQLVVHGPPVITTNSLPDWTVNEILNLPFASTGGRPPLTWRIGSTSTPPPGTTVLVDGALAGPVTASGDFTFVIQMNDLNSASVEKSITLRVNERAVIGDPAFTPWTETRTFTRTFTATKGTPPFTWSVVAGTLPVNASIGATTGKVTGVLRAAGDYPFTVRATDRTGAIEEASFSMHVNPLPTVTTTTLPFALAQRPYHARLAAVGGTGAIRWFFTGEGSFPVGFTLDPATGELGGTPLLGREFLFGVRALDSTGGAGTTDVPLTVVPLFLLNAKKNVLTDEFGPDAHQTAVTRYVELLAGTRLDGTFRLVGKGVLGAHLRMVDADTKEAIDLTPYLKTRGSKVTLSNFVTEVTRRVLVTVEPDEGFQGIVETSLVARARPKWTGSVTVDPLAAPVPVKFSVLGESYLTFSVARAKKSKALPTILSVIDAKGDERLDAIELKPTKTGALLRMTTALPLGDVTVVLGGVDATPAGACTWTATLKSPKIYDVQFYDRPAGEVDEP